jgi:maleate isomerase
MAAMIDMVTGSIRYGWRLRLGMLLPSSNRVAEPELPSMLPEGVAVHTTRLRLVGGTRDELLAMTEKVEEAAELVSHAGADLIVFHCTAVSTFDVQMEGTLKQRIIAATGKPAIATSEALVAAFRAERTAHRAAVAISEGHQRAGGCVLRSPPDFGAA